MPQKILLIGYLMKGINGNEMNYNNFKGIDVKKILDESSLNSARKIEYKITRQTKEEFFKEMCSSMPSWSDLVTTFKNYPRKPMKNDDIVVICPDCKGKFKTNSIDHDEGLFNKSYTCVYCSFKTTKYQFDVDYEREINDEG